MADYETIHIFSDGGARGNPGPAGAGAVLIDPKTGQPIAEVNKYLGHTTNNQAEYQALILALEEVKKYSPKSLVCYLDSELIVRQLGGIYKVKNPAIKKRFLEAQELLGNMSVRFVHIPREQNSRADKLANLAMDRGM